MVTNDCSAADHNYLLVFSKIYDRYHNQEFFVCLDCGWYVSYLAERKNNIKIRMLYYRDYELFLRILKE